MSDQTINVDIAYFSWTGNTKKVVEIISQELSKYVEVNVIEIKPKRNYPYLIWLFLSFIPNLTVAIECGEVNSPIVFICMPKWTYNCPPIASFLKKANLNGKILYLIITYRGFNEQRYAESYKNKIRKVCEDVKDILLIKRDKIEDAEEKVRGWAKNVVENIKKAMNR